MRTRSLALVLSILAAASASCTSPRTQLVPVVSSDLPAAQIACVVAEAGPIAPAGSFVATASPRLFFVGLPGDPAVTLPFSFGLVPPGDDASAHVELHVSALSRCTDPSDVSARTVTRVVRSGFVRGQKLALPIFLSSRCLGVMCADGLTCEDGTCVAVPDIDPSTLRSVAGNGDELRDGGGGTSDGGVGTDTGTPTDAGAVGACTPFGPALWSAATAVPLTWSLAGGTAGTAPRWLAAWGDGTASTPLAIAEQDGSGMRTQTGAATDSWGVMIFPSPTPNLAVVAGWRAGISRVFRANVPDTGAAGVDNNVALGSLVSRGIGGYLGGTPFVLVDEQGTGTPMNVYTLPAGSGTVGGNVDLGWPTQVGGAIASRADGTALHLVDDGSGCIVEPITATGAGARTPLTGSPCTAIAEASDGHVVIGGVVGGMFAFQRLSATLTPIDAAPVSVGTATGAVSITAGTDGSVRAVWANGATGLSTVRIAPDGTLGTIQPITTAGATATHYASARSARIGRATGVAYFAPALQLAIVCD